MNKQKIALLTDSCADIPDALLKQYDIHVVPLKLIFSDGEYADGVDIIPSEVYRRLPSEMPKTTLPSGESVEQVLGQIRKKGYSRVLAIDQENGCFAYIIGYVVLPALSRGQNRTIILENQPNYTL